jgi:tetratricopeptide (TPR) repeat protein
LNRFLRPFLVYLAVLAAAVPFFTEAAEPIPPSRAAQNAGEPYLRALGEAGMAYAERDFTKALDRLDIADQIQPNIPDTWNMRGAIYAEQHAYERAGDAFEKAAKLNPGDFWPPYNIAQLLLVEKKYAEAAAAFQKLSIYGGHDEMVQFKIIFADLLQGNADAAKPVLDAMKFPSDTAAYYFAHAAWGFAHKDEKEGKYWCHTGLKVFGLEACMSYYDALAGVGWVPMRESDGSVHEQANLLTAPAAAPEPVGTP